MTPNGSRSPTASRQHRPWDPDVLQRLHRPRPPETEEEITAWAAELELARESTSRGLKAAALQSVSVTAFTRQALRLPFTSVGPFWGIRRSGSSEDLSPAEHRAEVSLQASAVVEDRHVHPDVDFFRATADLQRWDYARDPQYDLPQSVLMALFRRGLDPGSKSDCMGYCEERSGEEAVCV